MVIVMSLEKYDYRLVDTWGMDGNNPLSSLYARVSLLPFLNSIITRYYNSYIIFIIFFTSLSLHRLAAIFHVCFPRFLAVDARPYVSSHGCVCRRQ